MNFRLMQSLRKMSLFQVVLVLVVVGFVISNCTNVVDVIPPDPPQEDDGDGDFYAVSGKIRTGKENYTVQRDSSNAVLPFDYLEFDYTVTNNTSHDLYLEKCIRDRVDNAVPQPLLLKYQDGEWIVALGTVCIQVLIEPIVVKPGESYSGIGSLLSNLAKNVEPKFSPALDSIPGTYKLRFDFYTEYNLDLPFQFAPMEDRLTNEFQIVK